MVHYDFAVVFYILSFCLLIINLYFNKTILQTLQTIFIAVAIIANFGELVICLRAALQGLALTSNDTLVFISFALAIAYLIVNYHHNRPYVGLFVLPLVIISGFTSLFLRQSAATDNAMENMWLYIHIPLEIIGTIFFIVAFATGLMYFIMEHQLKQKKFGMALTHFSSLATLDKLNNGALFLGFAFYTAGALSAAGWLRFHIGDGLDTLLMDTSFKLKMTFASIVWLVFVAIIFIKAKFGLNPRQTALASTIGFVSVLLAYAAVFYFVIQHI